MGHAASKSDLNKIYRELLGRNVDPAGIKAYIGKDTDAIRRWIMGSVEYKSKHHPEAQRQLYSSGSSNHPATWDDLDRIYRELLGRNARGDPGAIPFLGQPISSVIAQVKGSPEYRNKQKGQSIQPQSESPSNPIPDFFHDIINQQKEYSDWYKGLTEQQVKALQQQIKQQEELYKHYKGLLPEYEKTIDTAQGLLSGVQGEYNQAIEDYKKGVQAAITGQVPPEIQQHLENLRQLYVQKGRQDLEHVYNEMERRYMDTLAGKGILQSKPAVDIISKLREDEMRKIADQINQANTLYEQGMLNEPYKALSALGNKAQMIFSKTKIPQMKIATAAAKLNPANQMSGLLSASAQYPIAISNIGSNIARLPEQSAQVGATIANTYVNLLQPLLSWWNTRQQTDLQREQMENQNDAAMWGAFGQLVPFIFGGGLFG